MIIIEIPLAPVPWAAHRGYGKQSFNPRFKEREAYQWYIKKQYDGSLFEEALWIEMTFYLPIPKRFSKKQRDAIIRGEFWPITRPDRGNYEKFTSDCLTGIVYKDDSYVVSGPLDKVYAIDDKPCTLINIQTMQERYAAKERKK